MRRPLSEVLVEITDALTPPGQSGVRLSGAYLNLPVEVQVEWGRDGLEFLAELPRWRWSTVFDVRPGRMILNLGDSA